VFDNTEATMADLKTAKALLESDDGRRFDAAINEWHCRLNGCLLLNLHQRPVFCAQIYVEMPRRDVNVSIYNLKIELACTALKVFFEPCAEVRLFTLLGCLVGLTSDSAVSARKLQLGERRGAIAHWKARNRLSIRHN